jgi:hypothetical protein
MGVDYLKSEVIVVVVELCFQSSSVDDFKLKVKVRSIRLSISSIQLPYDHDHYGPNAQLGFSNVYDVTIIYLDQTLIILIKH